MIENLKTHPVAWLTGLIGLFGSILSADAAQPFLPAGWARWITLLVTLGGIALGGKTYMLVTPLARPRDAEGTPLRPEPPYIQPVPQRARPEQEEGSEAWPSTNPGV